jgi:rhodanese-related sulfurtransferase
MDKIIIDVREPYEYESGHVKGSLNIPPDRLMSGAVELKDVPKEADIVVYCRSGSRSNVAMNILLGLGYTNITNGINKEQVESRFLG